MSSANEKLEYIRKPRVHIKYEVETEVGVIQKELPFVVGVMGDFSGNPAKPKKNIKERKFITINRDNFNDVMKRMNTALNIRVKNAFADDDSEMAIQLQFERLEDFEPGNIVKQVPALNTLLEVRNKLRDLLSKTDRSDELEDILEKILQDNNALNTLAKELGIKN